MTVFEIVADVAHRLERMGVPYAVGGSLASSAWGQMRQTNDADIVIRLATADVEQLLSSFAEPYYLSREELLAGLQSHDEFRPVQLLHVGEAFKIDLFLLTEGPYETTELERARVVEIAPRTAIRFYAPENIVIAKLRWYVAGNRVSDRQWNDIVQVLEVQQSRMDEQYLDQWSTYFGVRQLLDEARSQISS